MCGIFGSNNFSKFVSLYDINKQRGYFSFGMVGINSEVNSLYVNKKPGEINLEHLPSHVEQSHDLFLGHTQAPTSKEREFNISTSHPFVSKSWLIAHNGIINNFTELKQKYKKTHKCPVDSSIIPVMLEKNKNKNILTTLKNTFNDIKGLAGVWCYNNDTQQTFLIRMGSTLFVSENDQSFSSIELPGLIAMKNNSIYEMKEGKIIYQCDIQNNTSFFTID